MHRSYIPPPLGPVHSHYPCFMCCSSSSPSCLTCTSGKLSTTSSTSATVERGMIAKDRSETIILCFKHLRSLHFDRFIKTLSNVQNKLSGLENSIKDISSRHDSKVGFYAFKVLPAFNISNSPIRSIPAALDPEIILLVGYHLGEIL